jgi:hypothetical protein
LLLGPATWAGADVPLLTAAAALAALAYSLATRTRKTAGNFRILRLGMAAIAAYLLAGVTAGLLMFSYHAIAGAAATHAYCATIRTAILAVAALALARGGVRWKLDEWYHLIYPTMALGAYRLLTDDLRQERKAALFLSLLIYGTALMVLPRLRKPHVGLT